MDAIRWSTLEKHFDAAAILPPPARERYLAELATADPELHRELLRLLAAADNPDSMLDTPALDALRARAPSAPPPAAREGTRIGPWRLIERAGSGGSGEVYRAERADGRYVQTVAVKLLRPDAVEALPRFEAEQRVLAQLDHPGIARLYDAGVTDDGRPYTVLEWVEGTDLTHWCAEHAADLATRLALFLQICAAVSWAHRHLLVHRDLKPANLRVTPDGQVKLLDFGIAKQLAADATQTLNAPLTLAYAAPEQLAGEPVTTATDVYALGVILFELLTGGLPWPGGGAPLAVAARRLIDVPVVTPSQAAGDAAPVPRALLRGDLDAIVAQALHREPRARYADARALADDIRRHLDHWPVQARADARSYVLRRTLRRYWLPLGVAMLAFAAMGAALAAITWEAHKAHLEAQRAAAVQGFLVDLFRTNSGRQQDPVKARQTTARQLLDIGAHRIQTQLADAPESKLTLLHLFGELYGEFALSSEQVPVRQQAVALSRRLYGSDSPQLAADLIALARVTTDHDPAERLLAQARAILDRRQDTHSFLRGELLLAAAGNNYTNDLKLAHADATQAVAILSAYPDSAQLAEALERQGITQAYGGDTTGAVAPLQRAVQVLIKAEGVPNPDLAEYYRQLGETESYSMQYTAAEAALHQAIEQARTYKAEYHYDLVRSEATLAVALVNADRPRDSLEYAARAKADAPPLSEGAGALYLRTYTLSTGSRTQVRAGALDGALADAEAAVKLARSFDPDGTVLVTALQRQAEALCELGRTARAQAALDQAVAILHRAGASPSEFNALLQIRLVLDEGHAAQARQLLSALPPIDGHSLKDLVKTTDRALMLARIDLDGGDNADAARIAADTVAQARASTLAPNLPSAISEGQILQGLASLRSGDADTARPLLVQALATRQALYLPQSPRTAEAELALAECALAQGRRGEAAGLVARAAAIEKQHSGLSQRYRRPLQRLRRQLRM